MTSWAHAPFAPGWQTHLDYSDVQQVYAGYVYGDSCSGQRAAYAVGMSGVLVFNVNNNCATGSMK